MQNEDAITEQLIKENKSLREENATLKEKIHTLEERIAHLEKNSSNSSKPPSSDIVKLPRILRRFGKKLKRGGQPGHMKFQRQPFESKQVDKIIKYELRGKDAKGLQPLDEWHIIQQIHLPEKMYKVIEHRARKYLDPLTGKIHIAPMPEHIRKGGLFGADMTAAVAFMKGGCHMSYSTVQKFFMELFRLDISRGLLCKAVQKVSPALHPAYEQLAKRLPHEPQVGADETGHHNDGQLYWTWCFDTPAYSLFRIAKSRGSKVLVKILGKDFVGIVCADYWGAYRKYARLFDILMQYCMAHLIREIRFLTEHGIKKLARWGNSLLKWIKKLFRTLHGRSSYTSEGFAVSMERIKKGFLRRMRRPPDHALAKKLARRFRGEAAEDYFRFITQPSLEPTNNGTERQIRPVVIDRRITQGTRGQAGMRWSERIWTILATCKKQNRNVFDFIHQSLLAHWTNTCYPQLL